MFGRQNTIQTAGIIFILAILVVCVCTMAGSLKINEDDYFTLDDNWDVAVGGQEYKNTSLDDIFFDAQSKGDEVFLSTVLPETDIRNTIVRLYSIHSAVRVLLDNESIYEYGFELREENKLLGYGYHFVELPDDYAGKTLEIQFYVTENDAFTSISAPELCNGNNVIRDFIIINKIPLAIILFLIIFGFCVLVTSLVFALKNALFSKLLCVGLFSIGIGFWSLCSYDLIILFTYNLRLKTYIEYTALYVCPLPVCLYFRDEAMKRNKWIRRMYNLAVLSLTAFIIASITLQALNIVHYPAVLKILHVILLLVFAVVIFVSIYDTAVHRISNPALIVGIIIMIATGLWDMIRFNIQKYVPFFKESHYVSKICLGALVFVLAQLVDFCIEISKALYQTAQNEALEKMAYTDALTGIYNRRKCEEEWDKLDAGRNYGILAFDLNNLKKMNDTNGHEMGDLLIKTFAEVLQTVFGENGVVGRMGGDEFMVIFPDMSKIELDRLLKKFEKQVEKVNEQTKNLNMSAAYGYCGQAENPGCDAREIYRMADARMYEKKIAMKCARI
jgi:diguanylate cyclase (GGDEF)-like protein